MKMTTSKAMEVRMLVASFISEQYAMLDDIDDKATANRAGDFIRKLEAQMTSDIDAFEAGRDCVWQDGMLKSDNPASYYAWALLERATTANMEFLRHRFHDTCKRVLILVKAQHPLTPDGRPGVEYEARLNRALEIYEKKCAEGWQVSFLCVGGIHEGCADTSLASAGYNYLAQRTRGKAQAMMAETVYSGNDEDWQGCRLFAEGSAFDDFVVVCSDGQYMRSYMSCLLMGVSPEYATVTVANPHQKTILELGGGWSVAGYLKKGPVAAFIAAAKTAERHKREAANLS